MNTHLQKHIVIFSLLLVLALVGNYFSIALFHGVHFIFGSVAVLMAIKLLGGQSAIFIAAISGSYTYFLWGHPYALIIFIAEVIVVNYLLRKKITSLAIADLFFWIIVGMPLIWIFYKQVMGMSDTQLNLILLKQPVNGIVNAILATYLLYLTPGKFWLSTHYAVGRIGLREALFTVLLSFSLLSTLILIIYQNNIFRDHLETSLENELQAQAASITHQIKSSSNTSDPFLLKNIVLNYDQVKEPQRAIIITSQDNKLLSSTLPDTLSNTIVAASKKAKMTSNGLYVFIPDISDQPEMTKPDQSLHYIKNQIETGTNQHIYLLEYSSAIIEKLQLNIQTVLSILFIVILIASAAAYLICNMLSNSIIKLTQVTKDLPEKIQQHSFIQWPTSKITEIEQLTDQTRLMARNISENLNDVNTHAEAIIESSADAIITTNSKGMVIGFNLAAEKQFYYDREAIIGRDVKILVLEKYRPSIEAYLKNPSDISPLPRLNSRYAVTGQRRDGSAFPMELSVTRIKLRSETIFTAIITDISARRASEVLKREFISTVSHELRTPLTSIKGSVKLMQAKKDQLSSEKISDLLDISERNVERLSELINDLLDFEKLDSGKFYYDYEIINPSTLINALIEECTPLSDPANIQIIHNAHVDCSIRVDSKRFSQVVSNLLSNAIKFSPSNSSIKINYSETDDTIKISVIDQGQGISIEFSEKIFGRFSQEDSSDTRKIQRGTGLGLAISKRITEDMGGVIGFDSIEGEGSTFYLIFPIIKNS